MLADKGPVLADWFHVAIDEDHIVGQFAAALGRDREQRAGTPFDVDPIVLSGAACRPRQFVQFVLPSHDRLGERLDHTGAGMKRH